MNQSVQMVEFAIECISRQNKEMMKYKYQYVYNNEWQASSICYYCLTSRHDITMTDFQVLGLY